VAFEFQNLLCLMLGEGLVPQASHGLIEFSIFANFWTMVTKVIGISFFLLSNFGGKNAKKLERFAKFSKPQFSFFFFKNNLTTQHGPLPSRLRPSNQGRPWPSI
jgi:hypothetical protein